MGDVNCPVLSCCKTLSSDFKNIQNIRLNTDTFTVGRGLKNSAVIPYLTVSRNHCTFKKGEDNVWTLEDNSSFGIKINGTLLGKGLSKNLSNGDIITFEQSECFVYKFTEPSEDECEVPRKRMKMDKGDDTLDSNIINDMRMKFEESQSHEIEHIEQKIKNVKEMQTTSMILKKQLQTEMDSKMKKLESDFTSQIESLQGERDEIERQKAILTEERDAQLATIKCQMEEKIAELMEQVNKHHEKEAELMRENNTLKEKLEKEREEFLMELSRENSSKQDMLVKLEAKVKEQEEVRERERQEALAMLHNEVEKLKQVKEQQIKQLEEQKRLREIELKNELDFIRYNLEEKVNQTEQEKLKTEQLLREQVESLKKMSEEEKLRIDNLLKEREEAEHKLNLAQTVAAKSVEELASRVHERETELAALAAERIQKQAEQSSEVISTLQDQLEKVRSQLQTVETEKNTILQSLCVDNPGEGSSKQTVLTEVGELMESELQCSICAELFITATTLNCSHTFCKYCITMWKKKKKDCPICRAPISSECKSLVLDTFIEKMVQNLSDEMKAKRKDILKTRQELENKMAVRTDALSTSRRRSYSPLFSSESSFDSEGEEEQEFEDDFGYFGVYTDSEFSGDSFGRSDDSSSEFSNDGTVESYRYTSRGYTERGRSGSRTNPTITSNTGRRGHHAGLPGAYYGGYGRCYRCGTRGHWAPGCPFS
ncbi:uncharacterized protein LOC142975650 isoform X1 [Anticarsia gemmatalis]|uniref:uncharacterized protein LOC142975650 isoform X1 n=1 Tax=Anticarsia gemmatalis TaxID=129554 RepID=UPI003F767E1F